MQPLSSLTPLSIQAAPHPAAQSGSALPEAWQPFPAYLLAATASGRPPATATWLKAARSATALHFLFFSAEPLRPGEAVAILIDPVGDLEAYFEFGFNARGQLQSAILRRSRSGHKRDPRWNAPGVESSLYISQTSQTPTQASTKEAKEAGETTGAWSATLLIPYLSIAAEAPAPGSRWLLNAQRWHTDSDGTITRSTLERLPRFVAASFPAPHA